MGKIKSFHSFNESTVSSGDLEDIKNIMNIASDAGLDTNIYEKEVADLTITMQNTVLNKVDNEELFKVISDVITRIDFLCDQRAYEMSWKIHIGRSSNERPGHAFNGIIREDDEIMKGWADRGYPAWGLNGVGKILGFGIYLNKIRTSRLDNSKLVEGSDNPDYGVNEATYVPCEISQGDIADIEMILNLAYDDGVKVLLLTDKADDLSTINRIDLVNQDNQLTDTEFNHVVANIYQRLCDVGVFRGYKEFQTTASADYNDDDFVLDDEDEGDEEWGGDDTVNDLGPTVSFRAVSIFRKIRRKGLYESLENSGLSDETQQDIERILTVATDEEIEVHTYGKTVQLIYPYDYLNKYNTVGYDEYKEISNEITNRLFNLGIIEEIVFYSEGKDEEFAIPSSRWYSPKAGFSKIELDVVKRYLESDKDVVMNDIAIRLAEDFFVQEPPEEQLNESNTNDNEVQQILNIARDEDNEVHCSDELSIRICNSNMSNEEFFKMCLTIDERLVNVGTFREGVICYKGIRGLSYGFLSELKTSFTESGMQANIKKIYDYSNGTVSNYPAGHTDENFGKRRRRDTR